MSRAPAWLLVAAAVCVAGCFETRSLPKCTSMSAPGDLFATATRIRIDVFDSDATCNGNVIAEGALPILSRTFDKSEPLRMDVRPGHHAFVVVGLLDSGTIVGSACTEADVIAGAGLCLEFAIAEVPDLATAQDLAVCSEGEACAPELQPCHVGALACATGQPICGDTGAFLADGTPCGTDQVCRTGACQPCAQGIGCAPANPCHAGLTSCSTGQPVCVDQATNLADGTICGTDLFCYLGNCQVCTSGLSCTPTNPCHVGQTSCATGQLTCVDQAVNQPNGSACGAGQVCTTGSCAAGCYIAGAFYLPGVANPGNACQSCQPATNTTAWTNLGNGTNCGANLYCYLGSCQACTPGVSCSPTNVCHVGQTSCATGQSSCVDQSTNRPDGTLCAAGQVCTVGSCAAGCYIGGTFYSPDIANPGNACQTCQPLVSRTAWTNLGNGTNCGSGLYCYLGTCQSCTGGVSCAPSNVCHVGQTSCSTGMSVCVDQGTNQPDGTACVSEKVCRSGSCSSGCYIAGASYLPNVANPANACQTCKPGTSTTAWTGLGDGTSCGTNQVCYLASCQSCTQGVSCTPANVCHNGQTSCSTGQSVCVDQSTNKANGTACGTGQVCTGGSCASGCFISGTFYSSGAANLANACQSCQPATSTTAWTNLNNGTGCGTNLYCNVGSCQSCTANVSCAPGNVCHVGLTSCATGQAVCVDQSTNQPNGTSCGSGQVCSGGSCQSGCYIAGTFYLSGVANPGNACQSCQPATSTTAWTNLGNGTNCGTNLYCLTGSCQSCTPGLSCSPANGCHVGQTSCSTGQSVCVDQGTNRADGTTCGGGQVCSTGSCQTGCYISSTLYSSNVANPASACQTCQPATSTSTWTNLGNGTTCGVNQQCSAGSCATCTSNHQNCDAAGGNGCECTGTACCGAVCQTAHPNGLGQTFYDCAVLGTHTQAQAEAAADAYSGAGVRFASTCGAAPNQTSNVCRQLADRCACWAYADTGTNNGAGRVRENTLNNTCMCPTIAHPAWN